MRSRGVLTVAGLAVLLDLAIAPLAAARSRDFSAPQEPEEPPLPRSGALVLSLALGVDTLAAGWYQPGTGVSTHSWQLGPELRLGVGVMLRERVSISIEGQGAVPLFGTPGNGEILRAGGALALGGIGVGADWFPRGGADWDLRLAARRSWATTWGFLFFPGVQVEGERPSLDVWLLEAGVGRPYRTGHVDRGWMLSVCGGPLWSDGRSGWLAGLSFVRAWSRS